jgi:hypothetical protein
MKKSNPNHYLFCFYCCCALKYHAAANFFIGSRECLSGPGNTVIWAERERGEDTRDDRSDRGSVIYLSAPAGHPPLATPWLGVGPLLSTPRHVIG